MKFFQVQVMLPDSGYVFGTFLTQDYQEEHFCCEMFRVALDRAARCALRQMPSIRARGNQRLSFGGNIAVTFDREQFPEAPGDERRDPIEEEDE